MQKRLPICIFVSLCMFEACGDGDNRERQTDLECVPGTYASECVTETSYTACEDDRVVIKDCTGGTVCQNGACLPEAPVHGECDPKSYVSVCTDETHRTLCSAGNAVTQELCPDGTLCAGGECVKTAECTESDFKPECIDDKHRTVCQNGQKQTAACEGESVCLGGECTTKTECAPEGYISECQGEKRYTVCTDAGRIESRDCEGGTVCDGGECVKEKQCDPNTYKSICVDATHYTACDDEGDVKTLACDQNTACLRGKCHPNNCNQVGCLCDSERYISSCEDDTYMVCENGLVTEYKCSADGLVCYKDECTAIGTIECDPDTYVDKCMGDTYVHCQKVNLFGMSFGYVRTNRCEDYLFTCALVDGQAGCYPPCHEDGSNSDSYKACDDAAGVNVFMSGKCVETSDQRYVLRDYHPIACRATTEICKDGECVKDERLGTQCDPDTEKSYCDGDRLYYCHPDGYFAIDGCIRYTLYNYNQPFASHAKCIDINNVTDCYIPCLNIGDYYYNSDYPEKGIAYKYECTETEQGLYYIPKQVECYASVDSKHFDKNRNKFDNFYRWQGNICVNNRTQTKEESCDGNVAKYVDEFKVEDVNGDLIPELFEIPVDCGTKQCVVHEGSPVCAEQCRADDINKIKYVCEIHDGVDSYISNAYQCTQIDGDFYWVYVDEQYCGHGCNEEEGCVRIHPAERKACSEFSNSIFMETERTCSDNIYLECGEGSRYGSVEAYDCGTKTCAILDDAYGCFEACDPKHAGKTIYKCEDEDYSIHQTCQKTADGKYVKVDYSERCRHGCDLETGRCITQVLEGKACDPYTSLYGCAGDSIVKCVENDDSEYDYAWKLYTDCTKEDAFLGAPSSELTCIEEYSNISCESKCKADEIGQIRKFCETTSLYVYECRQFGDTYYWSKDIKNCNHGCNADKTDCQSYHPDEGKPCDELHDTPKCADNDTVIRCKDGRYLARKCAPGICTETDGVAACLYSCTQSDIDEQVVVHTCLDRTYQRYKCYLEDGKYSWDFIRRFSCAHGCHANEKECAKIHKDEYSPCTESRCDGNVFLNCDHVSGEYQYIATQCESKCDAMLGCYEACSMVGLSKECIGTYEINNVCIEDDDNHIKYKQRWDRYCEHGCDEATNACAKIHEKEYSDCGVWDSDWEWYRRGDDLCDGQLLLECENDYVSKTGYSYNVKDCGSNGKCSSSYGCYIPCETPGEIHYCRDFEGSVSGQCIEDSEHHILRVESGWMDYCENGCDEATGRCK